MTLKSASTASTLTNSYYYGAEVRSARVIAWSTFFFFFFHLTYGRWTSSLPSCLWSQRVFPSLPGSRLTIFLSRWKFSTLTTRQPMVEFYLLTFPRFPLRKKEQKSYFGKNRTHEFRTSRCAAYLLDHSGDTNTNNTIDRIYTIYSTNIINSINTISRERALCCCCCILHINRSGLNQPSNIHGCQSGTWSQRGTKVNGSHHGDNPVLGPTGIQIATKSCATLQAMAPTNNKMVHQTSFTPYREQPRSTRIVVAYPRPAFSATNRTNTFQPVLINNIPSFSRPHIVQK